MPYTKSLVAGVVIFILLLPVMGSLPYAGSDVKSSFDLTIHRTMPPISYTETISKTAGASYADSMRYHEFAADNGLDTRGHEFNGYGGINGTITNLGSGAIYVGIADKRNFDIRYQEYADRPLSDSVPLNELRKISRFALIQPGVTAEPELALPSNASDLVLRVLPNPASPSDINARLEVNVRNYVPIAEYLTTIVFMADTDMKNFTIQITSKTRAQFVVYIGIVSMLGFNERSKTYGSVQYRQMDRVKDALASLSLSYSSRSKLMTRTAFGNLPEFSKGYYVFRAVTYCSQDVKLATTISASRPGISARVSLRLVILALLALYLPLKYRREIEYVLRKRVFS